MSSEQLEAAVVYTIRLKDPGAQLIEVSCRIDQPDPDGQLLSLPNWIPGSYLIRDFARHILKMSAHTDGKPVPVRKIEKARWRAGPADGPLLVTAEIFAGDLSVRGTWLDATYALINGPGVFLRVHGREQKRCIVHLIAPDKAPDGYGSVATSMSRLTGTSHEFGAFEAGNYEDLIDHPMLAGALEFIEFEVNGVPHELAIAGRHEADTVRLREDIRAVCEYHAAFFGGPPPLKHYSFLLMLVDQGYGGLEHRSSTALICDPHDLPRVGEAMTAEYRKFLGLVSHEYFHLWNVKRIRPAEFCDAELDREAYTRQLWVFEGITSYYDDFGLLRAGAIEPESYLELLGKTLTSVYRSRGRRIQTLEDSSFDAWIKFYQQDGNSPNAMVSYYSKGAMVALALDLELRLRTAGACSLDDVMRAAWQQYGHDDSRGIPDGGFEQLAIDTSGVDLGDFFRQALRQTVDPPVGILLAQFGVRLHLRAMESETDAGGQRGSREQQPRAWLGIRLRHDGKRVFIKHVLNDGPAVSSGLAADDELIAIDDQRVTPANFERLMERLRADSQVRVHCFRRGILHRHDVVACRPPRDTCYLTLETAADEATLKRRRQWLGA